MTQPTPDGYAALLERLVRADIAREPERYAAVRSFQDLHGVCDANEYLMETDDAFGYSEGVRPTATFINQAIACFHARMGWTTTATVDYEAWAQAETATSKPIPNCGACGKPVTEGQHPGCYTTNVPDTLTVTADVRMDLPEPTATTDLFPTVEEVGAKAIKMFKHDPNWWRRSFPLELAGLIDRWLIAHGEPVPKVILAGSRVRLRTVNGGDTICMLATTYRPGDGCEFRAIADSGTVSDRRWYRYADDIISVDIAPPRSGVDRCTCGSKYWDGHTCHDCGQLWLGISDFLG